MYDNNNLLGFKLSGSLDGTDIYIVHDTDNYPRNDSQYGDMYKDAERDAEHIARQFVENRISKTEKVEKRFFGKRRIIEIVIPSETGQPHTYKSTTVNTTNFFE